MKFLSNFGSCFRRSGTRCSPSVDALSRPLETGGSIGCQRMSRGSGGRSKPGAGAHWCPDLAAISEDFVAPVGEIRNDRLRKKSASNKGSLDGSDSLSHTDRRYLISVFLLFLSSYPVRSFLSVHPRTWFDYRIFAWIRTAIPGIFIGPIQIYNHIESYQIYKRSCVVECVMLNSL